MFYSSVNAVPIVILGIASQSMPAKAGIQIACPSSGYQPSPVCWVLQTNYMIPDSGKRFPRHCEERVSATRQSRAFCAGLPRLPEGFFAMMGCIVRYLGVLASWRFLDSLQPVEITGIPAYQNKNSDKQTIECLRKNRQKKRKTNWTKVNSTLVWGLKRNERTIEYPALDRKGLASLTSYFTKARFI